MFKSRDFYYTLLKNLVVKAGLLLLGSYVALDLSGFMDDPLFKDYTFVALLLTIFGLFSFIIFVFLPIYYQANSKFSELTETSRELVKNRNRLNAVLDAVVDGIITINDDGVIIATNSTMEDILGYSQDDIVGKSIDTILSNNTEAGFFATIRKNKKLILSKRLGSKTELEARHKNGSTIPIEAGISEFSEHNKRLFVCIIRDITHRRDFDQSLLARAKELKISQNRLSTVLNTVMDGIITIDSSGIIQSFNPGAERILQYKSAEVIGRNVNILMPDPYYANHDKYLSHYLDSGVASIMGKGREVEARRRDGTIFPMSLGINEMDIAGERMFVGILRDITEQKNLEKDLRDTTSYLQAVLDTVLDGIITINEAGYIEAFNPAAEKIFGYKTEEVLGRNVKILMPASYQKEHDGYISNYMETGKAKVIGIGREVTAQKQDGTQFPMELGITEMDLSGERKFVGIIRDISERKATEDMMFEYAKDLEIKTLEAETAKEKAFETTRIKSEFLANMSHEIRTPMNGIVGMTSLLLEDRLNEEQRERVRVIRSSGDALLNIINDILDLSKIESGKFVMENINFDLQLACMDILEILKSKAHEKGIELILRYAPQTPEHIIGDPGRLRQILMNLIGNGIKFTEKGSVMLNIEAQEINNKDVTLRFEVVDTGIGIPREKQDLIFESFSQAESSTARKFGGTGLGLAISKKLVEIMGGKIGVSSIENQGTTFWFTIKTPIGVSKAPVHPTNYDLGGVPILVADAHPENQMIFKEYAENANMKVTTCSTQDEAIQELHSASDLKRPYPVAILSHQLPQFDAFHLAKRIKSDEKIKDTRLIMVTLLGVPGESKKVTEHGFSGYLVKPVPSRTLTGVLETILYAKEKREEIPLVTRHTVVNQDSTTKQSENKNLRFEAKVLVAEDNRTNQLMITQMLEMMGCELDIASNGREAIDALQEKDYDIVLMDCMMPEMNGYEATEHIRKQEKDDEHITIIALTANALPEDKQKCIDTGMDDYLTKPMQKSDLQNILGKWLPEDKQTSTEDPDDIESNKVAL